VQLAGLWGRTVYFIVLLLLTLFVIRVKEVVMLLCELICQLPGKLACTAVGVAFDMYIESKGLHIAQGKRVENTVKGQEHGKEWLNKW